MSALHDLAEAAGVLRVWEDAHGEEKTVTDAALMAILAALGYWADSDAAVQESLARVRDEAGHVPAFLSVDVDTPLVLPDGLAQAGDAQLELETGETRALAIANAALPAIAEPGYHTLRVGSHVLTLAVAPRRCLLPQDLPGATGDRLWGTAIQIPSLHDQPTAYGDFGDLRDAVRLFAARGADAVAISPVHAPIAAASDSFSPYSPSSRRFLNPTLAELPGGAGKEGAGKEGGGKDGGGLIDWSASLPERYSAMRLAFAELSREQCAEIDAWAQARGPALQRHAVFDALSLAMNGADWREWPAEYRDPESAAVAEFAAENAQEIAFHLYAQWRADCSLCAVQQAAREAGMAVGLIADLAVGIDPGGSDAWALQGSMLAGMTVGAPPDLLGPAGQNWGLTNFSPRGLRQSGFAAWIATIRAVLRHAGGVRIDHAFGLDRLWLVPPGAPASDGAYVRYPFADMLRLIALESHRAGAIVVGEDLGTLPPGFAKPVRDKGILGMKVLWFERDEDGAFLPAADFPKNDVAMTGTHDLPTVAGWWLCRDIDWNRKLGRGSDWDEDEAQRKADRAALWSVIGQGKPQPADDDPGPVIDAAIAHLGGTPCTLAIIPLEDLLGLEEQPNLPGTIDEHPNWRRRLSAPLAQLLAEPAVARRIVALNQARTS